MAFPRNSSPTQWPVRRSRAALIVGTSALVSLLLVITQASPSVPRAGREEEVLPPDRPPRLVAKWHAPWPLAFFSGGSSPNLVTIFGESRYATHLRLWNARSGKTVSTFRSSGQSDLKEIAISPDGKYIAASGTDRVGEDFEYPVHVWEVATGKEFCTSNKHKWNVASLAFSPDSRYLVSGGVDPTIEVWDIPSGKHLRTLTGHTSTVSGVCFTPDGKQLLSAGVDGTIRVWDTSTGKLLRTIHDKQYRYRGMALRPTDGKLIAAASFNMALSAVTLWDLPTGRQVATLRDGAEGTQCVAFNKNGRWLATANMEYHNVTIWDVSQHKVLHKLPQNGLVYKVAFSPDGRWLAATGCNSEEGFLTLWDMYPE